jgi:hypothetical protein
MKRQLEEGILVGVMPLKPYDRFTRTVPLVELTAAVNLEICMCSTFITRNSNLGSRHPNY